MNSSMISKIEKAHRYAQEPERVSISALTAHFHGGHDDYDVSLAGEDWTCSCHSFESLGTCSHIMAMQEILSSMLTSESRYGHLEATPAD
jgi:hypothetical protein